MKETKTVVLFEHSALTDDVIKEIGRDGAKIYAHSTIPNNYHIEVNNVTDFDEFADAIEKVTNERPSWTHCYGTMLENK